MTVKKRIILKVLVIKLDWSFR